MIPNEQAPGVDTPRADKNNTGSTTETNYKRKIPKVKPGTKEHIILSVLASGRSINRFEAIKLHDTALNSTISTLQGKGIQINRKWERIPCVDNTKFTDVRRYSLSPDQLDKAYQLMGGAP